MRIVIILFFSVLHLSFYQDNNSIKSSLNKTIVDFKLKDANHQKVSLSNYKNAKGFIVVFTCNHCPFAKLYSKRFNELNKKYGL